MNLTKCLGVILACTAITGCASRNYDFLAVEHGPSRIPQLAEDLDRLGAEGDNDENELHDFRAVPFVHTHLHVFAESDDRKEPAGYIEAEFDAALPLFGFVNGTVSHYNEQFQPITRHELDSAFWGAFRKHREFVATREGLRESVRHTALWIFSWKGKDIWHPAGMNWDKEHARTAQHDAWRQSATKE
tara:strand:+ start:1307 stop:1870 length:564 start_codon:yes stop_codon:yes gene_type:complete